MGIKPFLTMILIASAGIAGAQHAVPATDTTLKGSTIEVLQSYKPQVKQVPKPEWIPQLPPPDTTHPVVNYDVPQQTIYYTYSSLPLRPLALSVDTGHLPYRNYVKLGGGNLATIFADAGIGSFSGKKYETGLHLHHLSQKGTIENQQTANSGAEADAIFHAKTNDLHAGVRYERDQYNYYGYDHSVSLPDDSINQVYSKLGASIDLKSRDTRNSSITYHPAVDFSYYKAKFNASETTIGISAPLSYKFDTTIDFLIAVSGALTSYKTDTGSAGNNYISANPGFQLHGDKLNGHGIVGFALGRESKFYILPDLLATYPLLDGEVLLSAGWNARLRQNSYEQLTTHNPYLFSTYAIQQMRSDEVFAGLQGAAGEHFDCSGRVSWWGYKNLPTFLNDVGDHRQFYVSYQNINAFAVQFSSRYHVANYWSAGLSIDLRSYSGGGQTKIYAWGEPTMNIKGDFMMNITPKFMVSGYLAMLGGMYAKDATGSILKPAMIVDLGGNAEYRIVPRLSAFVQLNNLLNSKYQRWYGYEAYGINIYGGVRFKF